MSEAARLSRERANGKRREREREREREGGRVAPRCADGSGVFDPGMQTARVEFRTASGGIGPD
jgi:hypothetical protein